MTTLFVGPQPRLLQVCRILYKFRLCCLKKRPVAVCSARSRRRVPDMSFILTSGELRGCSLLPVTSVWDQPGKGDRYQPGIRRITGTAIKRASCYQVPGSGIIQEQAAYGDSQKYTIVSQGKHSQGMERNGSLLRENDIQRNTSDEQEQTLRLR